MRISISNNQKNNLFTIFSLGGLLLLWKVAAVWIGREIILPGPETVCAELIAMVRSPGFWRHLEATILRGLSGFALSFLSGLIIGVLTGFSPSFDLTFRPLLVMIRSTPLMALIIMALIWFKSDMVTLFVTFLMVFPLVTQNVFEGIRSIDPQLKEMAHLYQVRSFRFLKELCLPAIIPHLAAGAAAGLGLTWKVMVAAEVLAAPRWGVGVQMENARIFLNTSEVLAWTALLIALGYLGDRLLEKAVRKRLLFWK